MLKRLNTPYGAMIVMDAGISSEHGYRYLVVSRERSRQFNPETAIAIENAAGETIRIQKNSR